MGAIRLTGTLRAATVSFLLAAVVVLSLGIATTHVSANTVAEKTERQKEMCETIGGGTLVVVDGPNGGNTTECKGGTGDGDYCFNTANSVKCHTGDHDPSNASGSDYHQDQLWQDVAGTEGNYKPLVADDLESDVSSASEPVGDPVFEDQPLVEVMEGKNGTNGTVAERTQSQREACETIGGGKLAVQESLDGTSNTTQCKGGSQDGWTCYNTPSETKCHKAFTQPEEDPRLPDSEPGGAEEPIEPHSLPVIHTAEVADEPLVVDPTVEGDAPLGGEVLQAEVAAGNGSVVPVVDIDEQQ